MVKIFKNLFFSNNIIISTKVVNILTIQMFFKKTSSIESKL